MKEQWLDQIRQRMAQREAPPPDGLWEEIVNRISSETL